MTSQDVILADDEPLADDGATTALAVSPERIVALNPAAFLPAPWDDLVMGAKIVASAPGLSPRLRDPDAAMFIAYQAARFGSDPIALASKVYFSGAGDKERIGYEAQWVMALIDADPLLVEPLDYEYGYASETQRTALTRFCKVTGKLLARSGRIVTRSVTSPTVAQIGVKNSPLWFSDPDQQLAYYTARLFGRRHRPARILGLYTREEIMALEMPAGRPALFEEEDAPALTYDGVEPTAQQTSAGERWENKAKGNQDTRDPRDDPRNSGRRDPSGPAPATSSPEPPPQSEGNEPPDLKEIREWAESERVRLVKLTDPGDIDAGGAKMQEDRRWRRLKAYDQADAQRIVRSLKNRIDQLEAE